MQATNYNANTPNLLQRAWRGLSLSLVNSEQFSDYFAPFIQTVDPLFGAADYRASVVSIRSESSDVYTLVLRPESRWKGFTPGQFVEIAVQHRGAFIKRCFSISSSLDQYEREGTIELSIRVQEKGRITPWLRESLSAGEKIGLSRAQGDFVVERETMPHLFIAGGSGITPFRSILAQLSTGLSPKAVLLYYAHGEAHLFAEELRSFAQQRPGIKVILIDSHSEGRFGSRHLRAYCPDFLSRRSYICGPAAMIQHCQDKLKKYGVEDERIFTERFGPAPISDRSLKNAGGQVALLRSGKTLQASGKASLLEEAEASGASPQSGCRVGVCHQCKCKKNSGTVFNTLTGQYSDAGAEEIQLCVSVAVGDVELDL